MLKGLIYFSYVSENLLYNFKSSLKVTYFLEFDVIVIKKCWI